MVVKKIKKGANWEKINKAKFKEGSFGNGAAMRAPILAMCYPDNLGELDESVAKCSEITHAHPLALEGAKLIAFVTYSALHHWETQKIVNLLPTWRTSKIFLKKVLFCIKELQTSVPHNEKLIKNALGNGIAAIDSCITAIYFSLKFRSHSHDNMLSKIYSFGGDTDTIGAMSGAIWGAFNGRNMLNLNKVESIEPSKIIIELAHLLYVFQLGQK